MTHKAPDKLPYDEWFDDNPLKGSKYIEKPVFRCLHDDFAGFALQLNVGEYHVLNRCIVPGIARSCLVMPYLGSIVWVDRYN